MNSIDLLREQLMSAHDTQEATMADVEEELVHSKAVDKELTVAQAYAHSVIAEDIVLSTMLLEKTPLSAETAIEEMGVSGVMPSSDDWSEHSAWIQKVKIDLPKLKEFAKKVYGESDGYLASLKKEDLDREIERLVIGKQNLAFFINNFLILHIANLTGEISAAKGIQGFKGYPF